MAIINDVELPSGEGGMNPILFAPQDSIPFDNEPMSLYEEETQRAQQDMLGPYREPMPDIMGIGDGETTPEEPVAEQKPQIQLDLLEFANQGPPRLDDIEGVAAFEANVRENEGPIARYRRREREKEQLQQASKTATETAFELAKLTDVGRLGIATVETRMKEELEQKQLEENFQNDFGWLNGNDYPTLEEFLNENYPDYKSLKPEELDEVYSYWADNSVKYYSGYLGANQDDVYSSLEKIFVDNPKLIDARRTAITQKIQKSGYNPPGIGDGEWRTGIAGLDSTRASIFSAASMEEAQRAFNTFNNLRANQIVDDEGRLNQAGYAEWNRLMQGEERDLIQMDEDLAWFSNFVRRNGGSYAAAQRNALDAAKNFASLSQLAILTTDPIVAETLSGKKKVVDPETGETTEVDLSPSDVAKNILFNPVTWGIYTSGMYAAQAADLAEEIALATAVGIGTAGLTPAAATASAAGGATAGVAGRGMLQSFFRQLPASSVYSMGAGNQEAALVASDLFQETMVKKGLDPFDLKDWKTAYERGFIQQAVEEAKQKGQIKGQVTAGTETFLDMIGRFALGRFSVLGAGVTGFKGALRRGMSSSLMSMGAAGTSEAAGQGFSQGVENINWNEVLLESLLEPFGSVGMQTVGQAGTLVGDRIFGKPAAKPAAGTQPPPAAGGTAPGGAAGPTPQTPRGPAPAPPRTKKETIADLKAGLSGQPTPTPTPTPETAAPTPAPAPLRTILEQVNNITGVDKPPVPFSAAEVASFFESQPRAKDAFDSFNAIISAQEEAVSPAVEAAAVFQEAEKNKQSLKGLFDLNNALRRMEFYSNLTPLPTVRIEIPQTSAERSAQVIEDQLSAEEKLRQSIQGRIGLRSDLELFNVEDQPFTEQELNQLEFNKILSPSERKQYTEFVTKKAANKSRRLFNRKIAEKLILRFLEEERIRQSPIGRTFLRQQLAAEEMGLTPSEAAQAEAFRSLTPEQKRATIAENIRRTFPDVQDLINRIESAIVDSDAKEEIVLNEDEVSAVTELIKQIEEALGPEVVGTPTPEAEAAPQGARPTTVQDLAASNVRARRNVDLEGFRNRVRAEAAAQQQPPAPVALPAEPAVITAKTKIQKEILQDIIGGALADKETWTESLGREIRDEEMPRIEKGNLIIPNPEFFYLIYDNLTVWYADSLEGSINAEISERKANALADVARGLGKQLLDIVKQRFPERLQDFQLTTKEATAPAPPTRPTPEEYSQLFREANATLPERAQATWTPEALAAADQFFATGDENALAGLNPVQQTRARNHYYGLEEERAAAARGMSVDEFGLRRAKQKGFINVGAIGEAVAETAVNLWNTSKDFADWSVKMTQRFGNQITEFLRDIWNRLNSVIRNTRDIFGQRAAGQQQMPQQAQAPMGKMGSATAQNNAYLADETNAEPKGNLTELKPELLTSLQDKVGKFFKGRTPDTVSFVNDISSPYTARIFTGSEGRANIEINYAYANAENIEAALYEEIGHYADSKGMLSSFYNKLSPTEKADVDAALKAYSESDARQADLSLDALLAEEREAKSFAAIAGRNKDLWTRIKNFINKLLADLGFAQINDDNKVADVFLKAMNAFRNQKEGTVDLSNRSIYYNKPARKAKLQQIAEKIDKSDSGPIRALLSKISISSLRKKERQDLSKFLKDTAEEAKAHLTNNIAIERSKDYFDRVMGELQKFNTAAFKNQFEKLKKKYPASLAGINYDSVDTTTKTSLFPNKTKQEVIAYIASLDTTEGRTVAKQQADLLAQRNKTKAQTSQQRQEREDLAFGESVTLALDAQAKIPDIINSPLFKYIEENFEDDAINVLKALQYLKNIDPTSSATRTKNQNEQLAATIDSAIENRFIGFGKYTVAYMLDEFEQKINDLIRQEGNVAFWERTNIAAKALQNLTEFGMMAGKSYFKKETLEQIFFAHPVLRDIWVSTFGDYVDATQTRSSSLQLYFDESLEAILEKHGLARKTLIGSLKNKDPDIFNTNVEKEKEEIYIVSQFTQWTEGSEDPIAEIEDVIFDMRSGFEQLKRNGNFMSAKATSSLNTLNKILNPAINDGLIEFDPASGRYKILTPPDVWSNYIIGNLKENQRKALQEIRDLAGELEPRLRFTQEFWYGKPWEGIVNYIPRSAAEINPRERTDNLPELNSNNQIQSTSDPAMVVHGSILHGRKGLGPGQYYRTDLETGLRHAFNSASYEVATAGQRAALHEMLRPHRDPRKDARFVPFFGSTERRDVVAEMYKEIHKAELKRDIAERQPKYRATLLATSILDDVKNAILNNLIGTLKNFPAQYLAPISSAITFAGAENIINAWQTVARWSDADIKNFYRTTIPDIVNRSEVTNLLLDRNANLDAIQTMASIDLKGNLKDLSDIDIASIVAARGKVVASKVLLEPKRELTKFVTATSDAKAAAHAFPGILARRLKEAGLIEKPSDMTLELVSRPEAQRALAQAKRDLSNITGVPGRYSLRPTAFVDKSNPSRNFLVQTLYSLMQVATSFAGDTILNLRDMSYANSKDKYASQIRKEAAQRMTSIAVQNALFKAISIYLGGRIASILITGFGKVELDEEEEKWEENRKKLRNNLKIQGPKFFKQIISEQAAMLGGPMLSNSIGTALIDVFSRREIAKLVEEEYEVYTEDLKKQIKRAGKGTTKEADLKLQLAEAQELYKEVNIFFSKETMGPIIGTIQDYAKGRFTADELEYARIRQQYYDAGGPIAEPDTNWVSIYLRKGLGFYIPDIARASRDITRTKESIANLRKEKLKQMEQRGATRVRPISIQ